jgi:hypothetical protein
MNLVTFSGSVIEDSLNFLKEKCHIFLLVVLKIQLSEIRFETGKNKLKCVNGGFNE